MFAFFQRRVLFLAHFVLRVDTESAFKSDMSVIRALVLCVFAIGTLQIGGFSLVHNRFATQARGRLVLRCTENVVPDEGSKIESKEITRLEKRIEELKGLIAGVRETRSQDETELKNLDKEYGGEIARIKKEFARMKERSWEEASEIDASAKVSALKEVLPITDNYNRAKSLFVPPQSDKESAILEAYDNVFKSFTAVIEGFGVTAVKSVGQPFDYNMMEAIMTAPSTEYAKVCPHFYPHFYCYNYSIDVY